MKKIKFVGLAAAVILAVSMMSGCGAESEQTVSTDGSTSMEKVIGFLSEAYMEKNQNVKVTYNPTGSGSGIQAVQDNYCDIGLSSRDLKDEEKKNLNETVVAIDGTGEITNWSEVGGSDLPIVCIGREAASGTRDGFESITGTADSCKYAQELTSTGDVVQTVSSNPNAVGYASLASVNDTVKALKVDGIAPSNETILNGTYRIQRNFVLVTRKDKELTGAAKDFFDFAMSKEADSYIEKAGAVPAAK